MAAGADKPTWQQRLQRFDRRWVFLAMGFAVLLPLLKPLGLPVKPSPMVKATYYAVEELKEGDIVLVSVDLDPAATPELEPFFRSVVLHLKRKNVKIVFVSTWAAAPPLVERWIKQTVDVPMVSEGEPGYSGVPDRAYEKYVDYVWLGFKEGKEATIASMGNDIRSTFGNVIADGTPIDAVPILEGIRSLGDFKLLVLLSAGFPGAKEYVQQVQDRYKLRMVAACTAVSTTDLSPYFDAGQLLGLVGGMAAAAEYETLVGKKGTATAGTDVLNFGHLVVIIAILFGNVIYFASRPRRRRRSA